MKIQLKKANIICLIIFIVITSCDNNQPQPQTKQIFEISKISLTTFTKNNSGLTSDFITNIEIDQFGNIWLGTFDNGIIKFDGLNWQTYNTHNSQISSDSIWDMAFDNNGKLWIGTIDGLSVFDGTNWKIYKTVNSDLPIKNIFSVGIDHEKNIWVGCGNANEGGLIKFDGFDWKLYTPENSILPCRIINKIFIDRENNTWIGTGQHQGFGGVVKISGNDWTLFNKSNSSIPYNWIDDISQDIDGKIWVASAASIYFEPDKGIFHGVLLRYDGGNWEKIYPHNYSDKLSNRITCLKTDRSNIWIAVEPELGPPTDNFEIAMFNGKKWDIISDIDASFYNSFVLDMEFDKYHNLWIGQIGHGLTKMNIELK